jgi:hypothetical protein
MLQHPRQIGAVVTVDPPCVGSATVLVFPTAQARTATPPPTHDQLLARVLSRARLFGKD